MRFTAEILGLEQQDDRIRVNALETAIPATRAGLSVLVTVPAHVGRHYSVGDLITVEIKPRRRGAR